MVKEMQSDDSTITPTTPGGTNILDWTEEDMNEAMAGLCVNPDDLSDPTERASYEDYLARHVRKNSPSCTGNRDCDEAVVRMPGTIERSIEAGSP